MKTTLDPTGCIEEKGSNHRNPNDVGQSPISLPSRVEPFSNYFLLPLFLPSWAFSCFLSAFSLLYRVRFLRKAV